MSLLLSTHIKIGVGGAYFVIPQLGRQKQVDPWDLLDRQPNLFRELQPCLNETRGTAPEERHLRLPSGLHTYAHI